MQAATQAGKRMAAAQEAFRVPLVLRVEATTDFRATLQVVAGVAYTEEIAAKILGGAIQVVVVAEGL